MSTQRISLMFMGLVILIGLLLAVAAESGEHRIAGRIMPLDHIRSLYWPAEQISLDATQCTAVAAAIINSGPKVALITCADNAAGILYGHAKMPDQWDTGSLLITMESYTDAADPDGVVGFDCSCQVRGQADPLNGTWGGTKSVNPSFASASVAQHEQVSSSATPMICDGATTATGQRHLFWRCVVDATDSTATPMSATPASSDYFPSGITVEYGITGAGD